jgi:hypothetical protein
MIELNLKIPVTAEEIKREIGKLTCEIKIRQQEIKVFQTGIKHYRNQCEHKDQVVTYDNDGGISSGPPCPTCGYSY